MTNIDRIKKLGKEWEDRIKNVNPENLREDMKALDNLSKETLELILGDDDLKYVASLTLNLFALRLYNGLTDTDINNWMNSEKEWWTDPEKVRVRMDSIDKVMYYEQDN